MKSLDFRPVCGFISETVLDMPIVTIRQAVGDREMMAAENT